MNVLTQATAVVSSNNDPEYFPAWMPDSRRLLVSVGDGSARRVIRVAIDTRQTDDVHGLPAQMANLALSPDGRTLAYHLADDSGGLTAWLVPANGGQPLRLSPPEQSAGYPAWSPDGRRIALEVEDRGDTQVWVINPDGTGFRQITKAAGQHWPHSWSPDSDRIAFAGERGGVWNVFAVSASTGVVQQLTSFSTPNGYVRYPAWSPRGDRLVFEHATVTANIWTARLTGGALRAQ
jgi:TolB protein